MLMKCNAMPNNKLFTPMGCSFRNSLICIRDTPAMPIVFYQQQIHVDVDVVDISIPQCFIIKNKSTIITFNSVDIRRKKNEKEQKKDDKKSKNKGKNVTQKRTKTVFLFKSFSEFQFRCLFCLFFCCCCCWKSTKIARKLQNWLRNKYIFQFILTLTSD